jgi:DNA-binding response OmpR family regulator
MCPHCGYNLEADKPLTRGRWVLSQDRTYLDGDLLTIRRACSALLYAVAKGDGRIVSKDALVNRISESATSTSNLVDVYTCALRKRLGDDYPFHHHARLGLSWAGS